jgi:hypothetical protein
MFRLCGGVAIAGDRVEILGLCSALGAFERGSIFIVLGIP